MQRNFLNTFLSISLAFIAPIPAYAHNVSENNLQSVLAHPFVSPDHLLTIIAVGIIAGGIFIWLKKPNSL